MLQMYFIYRPATRDYLQFYDQKELHTAWGPKEVHP
ncbi:hypothetical protein SAMN05421852_12527 [Thermoflavimicrobium dichotomicum]|uniref:Uncharacterized protein n=1 Tax=Thermoflavimicrobium dichotomicum TaxID=46223 RepID=A0A1I3UH82_9BACL|nr:hypothetical protein SAMN05421852_12527 [Thermoflavimicrobium dichotomicum]